MKNAGLSPGLIYAMGGAGGTSSTQGAQASTPSVAAPVMNPIVNKDIMGTLLNAMGNMADIKNKESGTGVDTEGAKLDNEWKKIENRIQISRENICSYRDWETDRKSVV